MKSLVVVLLVALLHAAHGDLLEVHELRTHAPSSTLVEVQSALSLHLTSRVSMSKAALTRAFHLLAASESASAVITRAAFEALFAGDGDVHVSKSSVGELFGLLDGNGDGELTLSEFVGGLSDDDGGAVEEDEQVDDKEKEESDKEKAEATEEADGLRAVSGSKHRVDLRFHRERNEEAHHTTAFRAYEPVKDSSEGETPFALIVRRGQLVDLQLVLSRTVKMEQVTLKVGEHEVSEAAKFKSLSWGFKIAESSVVASPSAAGRNMQQVELLVFIPANAPVGAHKISVSLGEGQEAPFGEVVILFNPWSKFDEVHMEDVKAPNEYVLATDSRLWFGDILDADGETQGMDGMASMVWKLHQFELLRPALRLLDALEADKRGSAVQVARTLSWMCNNSKNKKGVLHGRWKDDYDDGKRPESWTGSRAIFKQWYETKKAVKYGQCWVFAGILATASRSLGLPARIVTNFRSAHDGQPFDRVIDEDGASESIWNFHVWVETYIHRPALDKKIGTTPDLVASDETRQPWNVIDSTPQEKTDGLYVTGPAYRPLVARNMLHGFQSEFVIGEANAHVWLGSTKYNASLHGLNKDMDTEDVGRFVSTKKPFCDEDGHACREDLTDDYKIKDDPFAKVRFAESPDKRNIGTRKHNFKLEFEPKHPTAGQPITVRVVREELSLPKDTPVKLEVTVDSTMYTGAKIATIKQLNNECTLPPSPTEGEQYCSRDAWTLTISPEEYEPFVGASTSMRVRVELASQEALAREAVDNGDGAGAEESQESDDQTSAIEYLAERQFSLNVPKLHISPVKEPVVVGQPFELAIHLKNPLLRPLTGVRAHIDFEDTERTAVFPDLDANSRFRLITAPMIITRPGRESVSISFDSKELPDLVGDVTLNVVSDSKEIENTSDQDEATEESNDVVVAGDQQAAEAAQLRSN